MVYNSGEKIFVTLLLQKAEEKYLDRGHLFFIAVARSSCSLLTKIKNKASDPSRADHVRDSKIFCLDLQARERERFKTRQS